MRLGSKQVLCYFRSFARVLEVWTTSRITCNIVVNYVWWHLLNELRHAWKRNAGTYLQLIIVWRFRKTSCGSSLTNLIAHPCMLSLLKYFWLLIGPSLICESSKTSSCTHASAAFIIREKEVMRVLTFQNTRWSKSSSLGKPSQNGAFHDWHRHSALGLSTVAKEWHCALSKTRIYSPKVFGDRIETGRLTSKALYFSNATYSVQLSWVRAFYL